MLDPMTLCSSTSQSALSCRFLLIVGDSSGHGGQTPDLDGDEDDGYDEVIYPLDFKQAGHIVDDESEYYNETS